jgi:hypothetical protein
LSRWAVLGVEHANGDFEPIDWVASKNFDFPDASNTIYDVLRLASAGAVDVGEWVLNLFRPLIGQEEVELDRFLTTLEGRLDAHFGNSMSDANRVLQPNTYGLAVVGAHLRAQDNPPEYHYGMSWATSIVTEVFVPLLSVTLELEARRLKNAILTEVRKEPSIAKESCVEHYTVFVAGLAPKLAHLQVTVETDGLVPAGLTELGEEILLPQFLSEDGILFMGCLAKVIENFHVQTIRSLVVNKILKYWSTAGVAGAIDLTSAGFDIVSVVFFMLDVSSDTVTAVDRYEAVVPGFDESQRYQVTFSGTADVAPLSTVPEFPIDSLFVSGSYTFDENAADQHAEPLIGIYALESFSAQVEGLTISSRPISEIFIGDGGIDQYSATTEIEPIEMAPDFAMNMVGIRLDDFNQPDPGNIIDNDGLIIEQATLDAFPRREIVVGFERLSDGQLFLVTGTLDSLTIQAP